MKVRKYLLICIAAISLNALTACGGGSSQSDPLDPENPENPENPEPPAYFNPIEGEWIWKNNTDVKIIFTKNFEWKQSYFEDGKWEDPQYFRTYKMIDENSFIASNLKYYFTIVRDGNREIMTLKDKESDPYPSTLYRNLN